MGPWYWAYLLGNSGICLANMIFGIIWVCLELGYIVWYTVYPEVVAFLIRKVMINHSLWGNPIFRQAHVVDPCHGPATTRPLHICFSRTATLRKRTCHESRWFQLVRHESNCCSRHPKQALWTGTNIYIYIYMCVYIYMQPRPPRPTIFTHFACSWHIVL